MAEKENKLRLSVIYVEEPDPQPHVLPKLWKVRCMLLTQIDIPTAELRGAGVFVDMYFREDPRQCYSPDEEFEIQADYE